MIRKEIFTKIGGYNENFVVAEDLEFYSRAIFLTKTANLTEELVTYRIHKNNSIHKKAKIILNNTYKIQKNLIKNGFKISRKEYFFHLCFLIGKTFPPLGKYLIHIPENLRKILQKLKIIS